MLPVLSSGQKTSSALIYTGKAYLTGIHLNSDGTNDASLTIYDNTAGSGKILAEITVDVSDNMGNEKIVLWPNPVRVDTGIYAVVSGTNATYAVEYLDRG